MKLLYKSRETLTSKLVKMVTEAQSQGLEIEYIELTHYELESIKIEMNALMIYGKNAPTKDLRFMGYPIKEAEEKTHTYSATFEKVKL